MISGKAMIECGTGSTVSGCVFDPNNGIGMILMKSKEPDPSNIGPFEMPEEFNWNDAEVKFYFHNIDSLKSLTGTFLQLIEIMSADEE